MKKSLPRCTITCAIISTKKFLRGDITTNAATTRNPFIRVVPLFLKDIVVRTFYRKVQDKNSSAGLTNMGAMKVPEDMKPYIDRFDIYMGQPFSSRTNCAVISFDDTLTINFASCIMEADVERHFFRKLVEDGIHVKSKATVPLTMSNFSSLYKKKSRSRKQPAPRQVLPADIISHSKKAVSLQRNGV